MTTAPGGGSRTYDLLGNTTERNGEEYVWDNFGRLHGIGGSESSRSYRYRPDGLRILRVIDSRTAELLDDYSAWESVPESWRDPTYRYFYDGQMVHEDDYLRYVTVGGRERRLHTVNRYGLGARGMDWFEREEWHDGGIQSRSTVFPVYDGHGNNLASLTRNGSGGYALSNLRFYDAWGAPRGGGHDADTRYCASIGHRTDDESGLIYMRARYYEPGSGRFISEDPAMDGYNWYRYCDNNPINAHDSTGNATEWKFGDWHIRADGKDWHAYYKGDKNAVLSLWNDGGLKHTKDAAEVAKWSERLLHDLTKAVIAGNSSAIGLAKHMVRNTFGGFNRTLRKLLQSLGHLKFVAIAYTSVEAYAQYDPEDFADIMNTLAGRH